MRNMYTNEQHEWQKEFLNNTHIGILITDLNRKHRFANTYLCRMFGYTQRELFNQSTEILHIDHQNYLKFTQIAFDVVMKGKPVGIDYQYKQKDGSLFWVRISGNLIHGKNEILWTMVDITQHVEAQKEIVNLKERMELAIEGNRDVVWDWNLITNDLYVTPRWKDIVGYDSKEVPYKIKMWKKYLHPEDRKNVLRDINDNIHGKTEYLDNIHRIYHQDGHWVWIHLRGKTLYDENGTAIRMTGTHRDITQERELQLKNKEQAQIIEQIHDSVISTDLEGNILSWNKGSEILLEYNAKEAIGKHITMIYREEDYSFLQKNIEQLLEYGEQHVEVSLVKKSKDIVIADLSLSLLKDEKGAPIGMIGYSQDITERKKAEKALLEQKNIFHYQANHDALTQLPNRLSFTETLERSLKKAQRKQDKVALLFIDIDHFKKINDSLGHAVGDKVLQEVTKRFNKIIRGSDTLARLGGDEFTVIMENISEGQTASLLAQRLVKSLNVPIVIQKNEFYLSCSIGISLYPDDGNSVENLLKYSDTAMYKAKAEGRDNFQFYCEEMTEIAYQRVIMESNLRTALKNEDFVVYYQPQINAHTNQLIGMEALVRWQHKTMGIISPQQFIPLAESMGLIVELDRYVMKEAMKQVVKWYKEGLNPGILALNLSIKQLQSKDFISTLKNILRETGFKAQWLEFEISESHIMTDPKESIKILNQISEMGIELAIDDFGTGYSSLAYLKKFPIDKLKIDRSFISDLPHDDEDSAITKAVIALAKSLNLKIVAEGVETEEQKDFMLENSCKTIQGYYYSKPLPASHFESFVKSNKTA